MTVYFDFDTRNDLGFRNLVGIATLGTSTYQWQYAAGELRVAEGLPQEKCLEIFHAIGDYLEANP